MKKMTMPIMVIASAASYGCASGETKAKTDLELVSCASEAEF